MCIRDRAKVEWVIEEGSRVQEGDVLVRFDATDLTDKLEKSKNELKVAETKIEQSQAQLDVKLGDVDSQVSNSKLALQEAEMQVTDSETVPRVQREGARIAVAKANISVDQSQAALVSARLGEQPPIQLDLTLSDRRLLSKAILTMLSQ